MGYNLSDADIDILREMRVPRKDIPEIDYSIGKTEYRLLKLGKEGKGRRISAKTARKLLGDREFLSGIDRSTFHWNCVRETSNGDSIYFDSSALYR